MYFLSGLPRSGSTVLAAILNQRNDICVTPTSGLIDIFGAVCYSWETNPTTKASKQDKSYLYNTLRNLIPKRGDGKLTVDKSRGWVAPQIMSTMSEVLGDSPRIVATVRDIPSCAASFVKVAKPDNLAEFLNGPLIQHLKSSYQTLQDGYKAAPENILFIDYDELLSDPKTVVSKIETFWNLPPFEYDFDNIDGTSVSEDDENAWGVVGLHDIKPVLKSTGTDPQTILGEYFYKFQVPEFWKGEEAKQPDLLDMQVEYALHGNIEAAEELCAQIAELRPSDDRAAFNRGWYELRRGNLQAGMALLDRGRNENVFGNGKPDTVMPLWNGEYGKTVLLNLEGGLGDQIHGARYIKDIAARNCKLIVASSVELVPLFASLTEVSAAIKHGAIFGVFHDCWLPSMSAVRVFGYGYEGVKGEPYLSFDGRVRKSKRLRVGLRWSGNPKFEHEQHRCFPPELLFDALKGVDADFISLQRDNGEDLRPDWVSKIPLNHWGETREALANCDLVISSCTSVAHMAAAMGIETWIITPILPYYLWAVPGDKTNWYDSVTLFRQDVYNDWNAPIDRIKDEIESRLRPTAV